MGAHGEAERGWLTGPLWEAEVNARCGLVWAACPRFDLGSAAKARAIGDGNAARMSQAHAASERLRLGGVDELVALARAYLDAVGDARNVKVKLAGGRVLEGRLHHTLSPRQARALVGRTLDLKSAYRQLLVAQTASWANNIMCWDPVGKRPAYFHAHAMLFGTAASVMGFNRFAKALWHIGVVLFHLSWTNYVGDFPQLELAEEAGGGTAAPRPRT